MTEGFRERLRRPASCDYSSQESRADAGEQNHHVEIAMKQMLREGKRCGIVLDRKLAHGWRDKRISALAADQPLDFRRAPALERQYPEAVERHRTTAAEPWV